MNNYDLNDKTDVIVLEADGLVDQDGHGWGHWIFRQLETLGYRPAMVGLEEHADQLDDLPALPMIISGGMTEVTSDKDWVVRARRFVKNNTETDRVPFLGVCFGAQLIAETLYPGSVTYLDKPEIGVVNIQIQRSDSDLFHGIPSRFPAFAFHYNQIRCDDLIADSVNPDQDYPFVQSFHVRDRRLFGVQFHPEMEYAPFNKLVDTYYDLLSDLGQKPDQLKTGLREIPSNRGILKNYMDMVGGRQQ